MICDKCGKSNISGLTDCSYCGAKMPQTSNCAGFADILSFEMQGATIPVQQKEPVKIDNTKQEGISESDMQKLFKKTDNIIKSTQKNTLFGLIAIVLSLFILISSIVIGIITISSVNSYKEETMTQITETNKELEEYKAQIDSVLEEIKKENKVENQDNVTADETTTENTVEEAKDESPKDESKPDDEKTIKLSDDKADAEGNETEQ